MNNSFMLTDLTGRNANVERSQVTAGFQIKRSTFVTLMLGIVPGVLLSGLFTLIFGPIVGTILGLIIGLGGVMFLTATVGGDNVSAKRYRRIMHRAHSGKSEFTLCWSPIKVTGAEFFLVSRTAATIRDSDR